MAQQIGVGSSMRKTDFSGKERGSKEDGKIKWKKQNQKTQPSGAKIKQWRLRVNTGKKFKFQMMICIMVILVAIIIIMTPRINENPSVS